MDRTLENKDKTVLQMTALKNDGMWNDNAEILPLKKILIGK